MQDAEVWGMNDPITQVLSILSNSFSTFVFLPLVVPSFSCCYLYVHEYPMLSLATTYKGEHEVFGFLFLC